MAWRRKRGKTGRPGRPPPLSIPAEGPAALASPLSPNFTLEQVKGGTNEFIYWFSRDTC